MAVAPSFRRTPPVIQWPFSKQRNVLTQVPI